MNVYRGSVPSSIFKIFINILKNRINGMLIYLADDMTLENMRGMLEDNLLMRK